MSYKSAEKEFYEGHYRGGLKVADRRIDLPAVEKVHFARGGRYHLVTQVVHLLKERKTLLELGCAYGDTLRYAAEKYSFRECIGVDIALPENVSVDGPFPIRFLSANLNERFPFEEGSMDLVMAMMVFEHLFDPFHAFTEIHRILSPDGIAVINLPLVTGIKNRFRLLFGRLPVTSVPTQEWFSDREWDGNHLHYFSVPMIRALCSACKLRVLRTAAVGNLVSVKNVAPQLLASELTFAVTRVTQSERSPQKR